MAIQATSGSQREKWVTALLPAVAILLVGFLYITFYAFPALNKVEGEFNVAVGSAVPPDVVAALNKEAQRLRSDRTELLRTISSVDDEVNKKSEAFQQLSPTVKHSAVTAICREHGVAILKDQTVDNISLPALRMESVETLQSLVPRDAVSFRELTLAGDYTTIVDLLRQLPDISGVIPVSMKLNKTNMGNESRNSPSPATSWTIGLLM